MNFIKTIETKVIAAGAGGGLGAALGAFIIWLLGVTVWHQSGSAAKAIQAAEAVPSPVAALIGVVIAGLGAMTAGYAAPHTVRINLVPKPAAASQATASVAASPVWTETTSPSATPPVPPAPASSNPVPPAPAPSVS